MEELFSQHSWVLALIILWSIPWKGVALWKSAKKSHLGWFIALLIINSLAILDILYIFIFSKLEEEKQQAEEMPNMNLPVKINPDPIRKIV
jgi:hypothetical protein